MIRQSSRRTAFGALAGAAAGTVVTATALVSGAAQASLTATAAVPSGGISVAYYDQWSIYQNAFTRTTRRCIGRPA